MPVFVLLSRKERLCRIGRGSRGESLSPPHPPTVFRQRATKAAECTQLALNGTSVRSHRFPRLCWGDAAESPPLDGRARIYTTFLLLRRCKLKVWTFYQSDDGGSLFIFWFQLSLFFLFFFPCQLDCETGMSETFPPFLSWVRRNRINVQKKKSSRFTVCFCSFLCVTFKFRSIFKEEKKSMMVPSSSPLQVLLKYKAVRSLKELLVFLYFIWTIFCLEQIFFGGG